MNKSIILVCIISILAVMTVSTIFSSQVTPVLAPEKERERNNRRSRRGK